MSMDMIDSPTAAGESFDTEVQLALHEIQEGCLCPDLGEGFDPVAARMDLDRLAPYGQPNTEAAKNYSNALSAVGRGTATPVQRALVIQVEKISGAFGRLYDQPPAEY